MIHTVYILHSEKLNRYYTGYTFNLETRIDFHLNDTQVRKFTHKASDWKLVFIVNASTKNQALLIEKHIKSMKSKVYIENLIKYPEMSLKLLEKYKEATDC